MKFPLLSQPEIDSTHLALSYSQKETVTCARDGLFAFYGKICFKIGMAAITALAR